MPLKLRDHHHVCRSVLEARLQACTGNVVRQAARMSGRTAMSCRMTEAVIGDLTDHVHKKSSETFHARIRMRMGRAAGESGCVLHLCWAREIFCFALMLPQQIELTCRRTCFQYEGENHGRMRRLERSETLQCRCCAVQFQAHRKSLLHGVTACVEGGS